MDISVTVCVFVCVCVYGYGHSDFSAEDKASGVKFCTVDWTSEISCKIRLTEICF